MKRDLNADLAICLSATPGPWRLYGGKFGEMNIYAHPYGNDDEIVSDIDFDRTHDAQFIAEAREGWPEAIRRAIAAEAEVDRLTTALEGAQWLLARERWVSAISIVDDALEVSTDAKAED